MFDIPAKRQTEAAGAPETLDIFGATLFVLSDGSAVPFVLCEEGVPPGFAAPNQAGRHGEAQARAGACVKLLRGVWNGVATGASRAPLDAQGVS